MTAPAARPVRSVLPGLAALALAGAANAQISPGELSEAHADLDGVTNCLACHGIGENVVSSKCLDCHGEIGFLRERQRGLHGLEPHDCFVCHKEHGGRDFELVHWDQGDAEAFDHDRSGYVLDGAHARIQCRECHQPKYHAGELPAIADSGLSEESWLGLETSCLSCHDDFHESRLGTNCQECHTTESFRDRALNTDFDHDRTGYPLRGAHAEVDCESCHRRGFEKADLPAFAACTDCHADPHRGDATLAGRVVDCESCHVVDHFRPSTFTVARHRDTDYALEGAHAGTACEDCHGRGAARNAAGELRASFRFRPDSGRCVDCHADPHGNQLADRADGGQCESCHDVKAFRPSLYSVADHSGTAFALEGAHAGAACRDCHGPDRPLLPAVARAERIGPARVQFRFETTECASCHRDPHDGRYAAGTERGGDAGCVTCHGFTTFTTTRVDAAAHADYRFPLDGAHRAVPCFDCHRDLERVPGPTLRLAPAYSIDFTHDASACVDCHADPHGGQFTARLDGGACQACHDSGAFVPASLFDHDLHSRFPLEGAHADVACEECHFTAARTDGTEGTVYRPIVPHRCEDCHGPDAPGPEALIR